MKIKSAELIDLASHTMGASSQTRTLMPPTHEIELQADGWLRWRVAKGPGTWHLSPPSMLRNVEVYEEPPAESNDLSDFPQALASGDIVTPIRKRGRPAKSAV